MDERILPWVGLMAVGPPDGAVLQQVAGWLAGEAGRADGHCPGGNAKGRAFLLLSLVRYVVAN